ncbi:DNA-processing protein DprA [Dietzia psychralcaliphila]|uniref:DNA processing protein DprA n=2 Tax=Dietzia psychralcaliphila TaxID=139021 RepID=A0AAD0JPZ2_9ACTN|nr:DNA-processing protein DprA [Dietzia psychralcaliphila]AWH95675.1 DNA processing protein DprA [Dietzia psychralcaliphila]PTM88559.1 DNA protecting protein DprA [Dietzia psychralcaliphila]
MSDRGEDTLVPDPVRAAYAYLGAVTERPTAQLWDLVDAVGAVEAAHRIRAGQVGDALVSQTEARRSRVRPDDLLGEAAEVGARLLVPGDPGWPAAALDPLDRPRRRRGSGRGAVETALRPLGLWWRGPADPTTVVHRSVAVVGTRAPTPYGRAVTADVTSGVAAEGFTVVSGGAFGIDAAAHRAVLGAGGTTIAVLAGGVDRLYPRGNEGLLSAVAESGAVVSDQPPGTGVTRYRFLDRNRLIAALSRATVVVEAAARSGALSTAAWATVLDRPVGAVPGPVTSVASTGCHLLVRDGRAVLVGRTADVVELAGDMGETTPPPTGHASSWDDLDDVTRRVLEALPTTGGAVPAEVAASAGVPPSTARAVLGRLLVDGAVLRGPSGWRRSGHTGRQLTLPVD